MSQLKCQLAVTDKKAYVLSNAVLLQFRPQLCLHGLVGFENLLDMKVKEARG